MKDAFSTLLVSDHAEVEATLQRRARLLEGLPRLAAAVQEESNGRACHLAALERRGVQEVNHLREAVARLRSAQVRFFSRDC